MDSENTDQAALCNLGTSPVTLSGPDYVAVTLVRNGSIVNFSTMVWKSRRNCYGFFFFPFVG